MNGKTRIMLLAALLACLLLLGAGLSRSGATAPVGAGSPSPYALTAWSADCGGTAWGTSGLYTLGGTLGQPDATGVLVSGRYGLVGGLWGGPAGVPDIAVTAPPLEATLCPGAQTTLNMQICNQGTAALDWSISHALNALPWWSADPESGTLPAGDCQPVAVTLGSATPGSYAGTLLIESNDPDTPQVSLAVSLTVLEPAHGAAFTWSPSPGVAGEPVSFSGTAQGTEPISYTWEFGDGGGGGGASIDHTFALTGTYQVTLTASNTCGPATVQHDVLVVAQAQISVDPGSLSATLCPDATSAQALTICNLGDVDLTWSVAEIPGELPWLSEDPGSGTLAGHACQAVQVTFDAAGLTPGAYAGGLRVTSNDPNAPQVDVPVDLTVRDPVHDAAFEWGPAEPVVGQPVDFQASAQGTEPIGYAWAFGDGGTGNGVAVSHTYAAPGDYLVTLTVSNDCGTVVVTHEVTVQPQVEYYVYLFRTKLNWAYAARPGWVKAVFLGIVRDQDGIKTQGATVHGFWTLPDGSTIGQTAVTDFLGRFKFRWKGPWMAPGTYSCQVTDIVYDDCTYDPAANENPDYRAVTIPPPPY